MIFTRNLKLPTKPTTSFFLWGPRQTGKTTLLNKVYPKAHKINLLKRDLLLRYLQKPWLLREELLAKSIKQLVVIDEIQKVPALLDEVHYLIEEENMTFVLCGSSARKVKRGHANLLGGRALKYELLGLSMNEIADEFDLIRIINTGPLPSHYLHKNPYLALRSYVEDYLKEEILDEGIVRNLPIFSDFLRASAIGDTEVINLTNIARECGVSAATVRDHYSILTDTLLGAFVPAFTKKPKRRTIQAPKFYFRDVGIVNHLVRRREIEPGTPEFGKAFENWLFHELSVHSRYSEQFYDITYWRLTTGVEVDFIIYDGNTAIEVKGKEKITSNDLKGLIELQKEYPEVKNRIIVCLEPFARKIKNGILILPYQEFINRLYKNEFR